MKLTVSVELGRKALRPITWHHQWSSSPQVSSGKWIPLSICPKATTGQFCAKAVLSKNLEAVSRIVTDAARAGAKMIFLPEASDFIASAGEIPSLTKPLAQNEFVLGLRAKAKETGVWVSVGVHETVRALHPVHAHIRYPVILTLRLAFIVLKSSDPKRGYNSHLIIDSSGDIVSNYHKIHLFVRHVRPNLSRRELSWVTRPIGCRYPRDKTHGIRHDGSGGQIPRSC